MSLDRQSQIEYLLEHFQHPHHRGAMPDADAHVEGGHPGCSDVITIYLKFNGNQLDQISFMGEGCTVSQASASILTDLVQGMSIRELEELDHTILVDELGEEVIRTRPRCSTLSLDVLKAALREYRNKLRNMPSEQHRIICE
jgi:nitrogen fixation NifU-like protein